MQLWADLEAVTDQHLFPHTRMPSTRDTLVRHGLYAYLRHPIYAGGLLVLAGLAVLQPTQPCALACALGIAWLFVQAKLQEIDLVQRLPAHREYMREVPGFLPRLGFGRRWPRRTRRCQPLGGRTAQTPAALIGANC